MATQEKRGLSYYIPEVLEEKRTEKGWSYRELARHAEGLSHDSTIRYLQGTRALPVSALEAICAALGTEVLTIAAEAHKRMQ